MIAWKLLISAIALLLVFEGVLPFINPDVYRKLLKKMQMQPNKALRIMGFF